jgi:hypothetical protein
MKHRVELVSLTIQDVAALDGPIELGPFSRNVSVIRGHREGASASVVLALRAVLFERHDARHDGIQALRAKGTPGAPEIGVELCIDGEPVSVRKRFLDRPFVEVRLRGEAALLTGAAAEELLLARLRGDASREPGRAQNDAGSSGGAGSALDPAAQHAAVIAQLGAIEAELPALDAARRAAVAAEAEAHAREVLADETELDLANAEAELAAVHRAIAASGASTAAPRGGALWARHASAMAALVPAHRRARDAAAALDGAPLRELQGETLRAGGAIAAGARRAAELRGRAQLLAAWGVDGRCSLPLVFEDPTPWPDDAGWRSIVQALREASRERQILVLTAHPSRFDRLQVDCAVDLDRARDEGRRASRLDTLAG